MSETYYVNVVEGRDLSDNYKKFAKSDPYVKVYFPKENHFQKTHVIKDNHNPQWNEEMEFPFKSNPKSKDKSTDLKFIVLDKDTFSDDNIGEVIVPLTQIQNAAQGIHAWFPLKLKKFTQPKPGKDGKVKTLAPAIRLKLAYGVTATNAVKANEVPSATPPVAAASDIKNEESAAVASSPATDDVKFDMVNHLNVERNKERKEVERLKDELAMKAAVLDGTNRDRNRLRKQLSGVQAESLATASPEQLRRIANNKMAILNTKNTELRKTQVEIEQLREQLKNAGGGDRNLLRIILILLAICIAFHVHNWMSMRFIGQHRNILI